MITYNITDIGEDSLYEYLYKCIKNDILSGVLAADEKLPSKRNFANNMGISVITVENAYGQLMAEGYIYSLPKKGFYVSKLNITNKGIKITSNTYIRDEKIMDIDAKKKHFLADFSSNQTDSNVFPFSIWTKTMRDVMNDYQTQLLINSPCGGILELRESIASYLRAFRGMNISPKQIIVGAGTEYLHGLLIQLLGSDITYGVEDPGYSKIYRIYDSMKVRCRHIPIDNQGVAAESLENNNIDVIHISPSHHFPTGIVMPVSRRYELLSWASKSDTRYIIEDDYDSELRLQGRPIPTLQSIDVLDKVIYMNTFTKTLCSTVRISYMVLPMSLTERFYNNLSFYSCTVSNFEQYTLATFIREGYFEKHINRLRNYYQNKRDAILEAFTRHRLGERLTITEEEAGVHFLMHINTARSEEEIVRCCQEKKIKLVPLSDYYYNHESKNSNTYVMNYSSVDSSRLQEIADTLYQAIED